MACAGFDAQVNIFSTFLGEKGFMVTHLFLLQGILCSQLTASNDWDYNSSCNTTNIDDSHQANSLPKCSQTRI